MSVNGVKGMQRANEAAQWINFLPAARHRKLELVGPGKDGEAFILRLLMATDAMREVLGNGLVLPIEDCCVAVNFGVPYADIPNVCKSLMDAVDQVALDKNPIS